MVDWCAGVVVAVGRGGGVALLYGFRYCCCPHCCVDAVAVGVSVGFGFVVVVVVVRTGKHVPCSLVFAVGCAINAVFSVARTRQLVVY